MVVEILLGLPETQWKGNPKRLQRTAWRQQEIILGTIADCRHAQKTTTLGGPCQVCETFTFLFEKAGFYF